MWLWHTDSPLFYTYLNILDVFMDTNVLLVYVFVPCADLVTAEVRGHQIPWNWNYTPW